MKNNMVHYDGYVAGWLDSSIRDFLAVIPSNSESAAYALITCLDSNLDPASLLRKNSGFRRELNGARSLKKDLLIPSKVLQKASLRNQLFLGFDEIWFFPSDDIEPKPEAAWIVGPKRIDQAKLDKLGHWMAENACSLALGDGQGLNVVVKAHGLVKYLLAHSILQPEPKFQRDEHWVEDEEKKTTPKLPKFGARLSKRGLRPSVG